MRGRALGREATATTRCVAHQPTPATHSILYQGLMFISRISSCADADARVFVQVSASETGSSGSLRSFGVSGDSLMLVVSKPHVKRLGFAV